jgi:hypothetical protein
MSSSIIVSNNVWLVLFVFLAGMAGPIIIIFCIVAVFCTWKCYITRAHLDVPSMSSKFFSLFLFLSTELLSSCNVGRRHNSSFSPFMLALCLAPNAAWSYFSMAAIYSSSPSTTFEDILNPVAYAAGCVEVSFSYATMLSTSCTRS